MTMAIPAEDARNNIIKPIVIKAVIFDLDGTLLDTEGLSCRAVIDSFELSNVPLPSKIRETLKSQGDLLPWELKSRILGLRGSEWVPKVLAYAQEYWEVDMDLDWTEGWDSRCTINDKEENESRHAMVDTFWKAWEVRSNELCAEVKTCPGAPQVSIFHLNPIVEQEFSVFQHFFFSD